MRDDILYDYMRYEHLNFLSSLYSIDSDQLFKDNVDAFFLLVMGLTRLAGGIAVRKKMYQQIDLLILTHLPLYYSKSLRAKSYPEPFLSYHQAHTSVGAGVHIPTLVRAWWYLKNGSG